MNIKNTIIFMLLICFYSCKNDETNQVKTIDNGTKEMVEELNLIAKNNTDVKIWYLNKERALDLDKKAKSATKPGLKLRLTYDSAIQWLNAGYYDTAISRLESILYNVKIRNIKLPDELSYKIKEILGMAYLRKAEIENCVQNHNEYSCILPIEKEGQHINRQGAENALKIFRELLHYKTYKYRTKWLYNIAHMTLGSYPDKVEKEFLLDQSIFESDIEFPRFKEIGMSTGVGVNDISGSVVMDDFNNDGFLDLLVSSYGVDDQLYYFQNNTKNGFDDLTEQANLTGLFGGLNMVQTDYNNDGWIDVLVLRGGWLNAFGDHPNSLLKNNGDGTFSDVTKESGLYSRFPTQTASWADFNNDGWIDLFIGNEHSSKANAPSELYQNNGDGTFKNVSEEKNILIKEFVKGCIWGDYNNDNYPDLYVSVSHGQNYLLENQGPKNDFKFINKSVETNTIGPKKSFPCWFFDYNQDGWEDLFVSGFDFNQFKNAADEVAKDYLGKPTNATLPKLYKNNKDGTFTDVSKEMGIDKVLYTMGCNFGDLNNDGFPDFYAGTGTPDFRSLIPNRMFLNDEGNQFLDITTAGGFGHLQKGHGIALGDLDNDGNQDIYNVLGGSFDGDNFMNALFLNPGNSNNWIKLKLKGTTSNKSGIGAKVKITALDKDGKSKAFYKRLNSGGSFGANPLIIEQGLGDCNTIQQIEITWPGQTSPQLLNNIKANSYLIITQNSDTVEELNTGKVSFKEHNHHH